MEWDSSADRKMRTTITSDSYTNKAAMKTIINCNNSKSFLLPSCRSQGVEEV
jgi:hypothetical protein